MHVHDGLPVERLGTILATRHIGWLLAMPGMIDTMLGDAARRAAPADRAAHGGRDGRPVPRHQIAALSGRDGRTLAQQLRRHRDRLPPASAKPAGAGRGASVAVQAHQQLLPHAAGGLDDREVGIDEPGEMTLRAQCCSALLERA